MRYMGSISIDCQKKAHRAELGNFYFDVIQCEFDGSYFFGGKTGVFVCVCVIHCWLKVIAITDACFTGCHGNWRDLQLLKMY